MSPTARDYAWATEYSDAYCLTLARGMTPRAMLLRMGAEVLAEPLSPDEAAILSYDLWDAHGGDRMLISATTVTGADGDWVLGVETTASSA